MQLTKAEEQIMQILWTLKEATVQDILKNFRTENKPARTTVATILSILENKGFALHNVTGRTNIYYPIISKKDYSRKQLLGVAKDYFNGSFTSMFSFFAKEENLTLAEIDEILNETKKILSEENKKNHKTK